MFGIIALPFVAGFLYNAYKQYEYRQDRNLTYAQFYADVYASPEFLIKEIEFNQIVESDFYELADYVVKNGI